jgi:Tol biopolymer transport system component
MLSIAATNAGMILGTAAYMSPEQAKGKVVDKRADIWAFGTVCYEMLTGHQAFQGETAAETMAHVMVKEPDWEALPANTPARLRDLLRGCLVKDPRKRMRDMGDARISLDEVLSGVQDPRSVVSEKSSALSDLMCVEISLPAKVTLGGTGAFAISPDGRHLAFYANSSDGLRLWVRSLDSLEARPLYGSESPTIALFFWSPDSRFLVFEAGGKLKKIDIAGGPAQTLCQTNGIVVGGAWNRDGVIIFGHASASIMRVSASGGAASPVTTLDPSRKETWHTQPSFLPDGRHFIYLRGSHEPENTGIYVGSLDARPEEQDLRRLASTHIGAAYVPPSEAGMGQFLFIRDGTLMGQRFDASRFDVAGEPVPLARQVGSFRTSGFYSASNTGVLVYRTGTGETQLSWFDQRGKRLGTVGEPSTYISMALSPDGTRAVVSRGDSKNANIALWIMDLGRGTSSRFTFGRTPAAFGIWSADGSRVIFPFGNGGKYNLYQKIASGLRDHELLLESDESKVPRSCSRDGRFLLYTTGNPMTGQTRELWVLPLEGDKKPIPFARTSFNHIEGQFSPDGRWVAYVSDESGRDEIYIRTFRLNPAEVSSDDEGKWLISTAGGREPRWSGDGKTLYYIATDGQIMAVQITANQAFRVGAPKALFQTPPSLGATFSQSWSVTPDGKRFLFLAMAEQRQAPFNVVLNWPAALKK